MRRTARFVVAVLVIVAFPRPATAQTVVGLPGRETREVIRDSPVYIAADSSLVPLTTLSSGTRVSLRRRSAQWTLIEFTDPRWGARTAYIRTDALSPSGSVVNTPAGDDTAGLTARTSVASPHPGPARSIPQVQRGRGDPVRQEGGRRAGLLAPGDRALELSPAGGSIHDALSQARARVKRSEEEIATFRHGRRDAEHDRGGGALIGLDQDVKGGAIANVERIFVMPKGVKDPTRAVLPEHTEQLSEEYKHTIGLTAGERGVIAVFPLSILREGNEVRVIFDRKILDARGGASYCNDCAVPVKLKGVR